MLCVAPQRGGLMSRHRTVHLFACLTATVVASACAGEDSTALQEPRIGSHTAGLRDMTGVEASTDLEQIFSYVDNLYGAYEYKEARFGYSIAALEANARTML